MLVIDSLPFYRQLNHLIISFFNDFEGRDCMLDVYGRETSEYAKEEVFGGSVETGCWIF